VSTRRAYGDTFWQMLAPIRLLLADPSVSEILINGPDRIFVERNGTLELSGCRLSGSSELLAALRSAVQYAGDEVDESERLLALTLPDGVRLWAALPPLASDGPLVRIRRADVVRSSLADLSRRGALPNEVAQQLAAEVEAGSNMVVAGRSRSGKTTVLAALAGEIPPGDRVLVMDHGRELQLARDHVVCLDAAEALGHGESRVEPYNPFRAALLLRPDWILLSRLIGVEALALIRLMALRDVRCLATVEATSARDALGRIEALARWADRCASRGFIRSEIAVGLDVVIHVEPDEVGGFRVAHVAAVSPSREGSAEVELKDLFVNRTAPECSGDDCVLHSAKTPAVGSPARPSPGSGAAAGTDPPGRRVRG
jgi:pilus assembly protein CpaF